MSNETIELRQFSREELYDSFTLSEFAFQFELSQEDKEERVQLAEPKQSWGVWIDGKLASKLSILDFHIWIGGKKLAMGGIAGVATWPEYRRQGLVGGLLRHALKTMREQGQTISLLAPFEFPFYRRYGWETLSEYRKYKIEIDKIKGVFRSGPGSMERVALEPAILGPVYEAYARQYNGMLSRDEKLWHDRIFKSKKGTAAVYRNEAGEAQGYVFYRVRDKIFQVHELVWLDEEARGALWKFIADHDSMIERIELQAPSDDKLPFLLPNPRFAQETVPYFMARIVDVAKFLEQYPFAAGGEEEVYTLRIQDENAEWNEGAFLVRIDRDGRAQVNKLEGAGSAPGSLALEASIQTLSTLLIGYQDANSLREIGRLACSPEAAHRLDARIARRTPYLADFF